MQYIQYQRCLEAVELTITRFCLQSQVSGSQSEGRQTGAACYWTMASHSGQRGPIVKRQAECFLLLSWCFQSRDDMRGVDLSEKPRETAHSQANDL